MTRFIPATSYPFEERPNGPREWGGDPRRQRAMNLEERQNLLRGKVVRVRGPIFQYVAALGFAPTPAPETVIFMGHPSDSSPQEIVVSWNANKNSAMRSTQWVDVDVFQQSRSGGPDRPVFRSIRQHQARKAVQRIMGVAGLPQDPLGKRVAARSLLVNQPLYCRIRVVNNSPSPAWWDDPSLTIIVTAKLLSEAVY